MAPTAATSHPSERRESPRHYLTRPMRAELVYGRQRIGIEQGRIHDISQRGLRVRTLQRMHVVVGAPITIAVPQSDRVLTLSGRVTGVRQGIELGIRVGEASDNPLAPMLDDALASVMVSPLQNGRVQLSGTVSMSARHPLKGALQAGATRLDMAAVRVVDSSGIGLLLQLHERSGITVEQCQPQICRLIKLCRTESLCSADCARAAS